MTRPLDAILTAIHVLKPNATVEAKITVVKKLISELESGNGNGYGWSATSRLRMAIAHFELFDREFLAKSTEIAKIAEKYKQTAEGKEWLNTISKLSNLA